MDSNKSLASLYDSYVVHDDSTWDAIKRVTCIPDREDRSFYYLNIDELVRRVKLWRLKLPRVQPHYAVKCNNDLAVLRTLALLGTGFDCASRAEMETVLSLDVSPSRIIFAHPCKIASHVKYARNHQIKLMTFDSSQELVKVSKLYPDAGLVIRIRCDAVSAQCELGIKFGVIPEEAQPLLAVAAQLKLKVIGVAFHVGSGCSEPQVFLRAIKAAKQVFLEAEAEGHSPTLLDIGGGFMGGKNSTIDEAGDYINAALDEHFPRDCGVRIIAEPGRYMVAASFTLVTPIINRRDVTQADQKRAAMHFIDDGVYGSFNCILYDHQVVTPIPLEDDLDDDTMEASVWGPTCDGFDLVIPSMQLPSSLSMGDWLVWEDMGAYTLAAAGSFNGFPLPKVIVHMHSHTRVYLLSLILQQQEQLTLQLSEEQDSNSEKSSGISSDDEANASPRLPAKLTMCNLASKLEQKLLLDGKKRDEQNHRAALVDALFQPTVEDKVCYLVKGDHSEQIRKM